MRMILTWQYISTWIHFCKRSNDWMTLTLTPLGTTILWVVILVVLSGCYGGPVADKHDSWEEREDWIWVFDHHFEHKRQMHGGEGLAMHDLYEQKGEWQTTSSKIMTRALWLPQDWAQKWLLAAKKQGNGGSTPMERCACVEDGEHCKETHSLKQFKEAAEVRGG